MPTYHEKNLPDGVEADLRRYLAEQDRLCEISDLADRLCEERMRELLQLVWQDPARSDIEDLLLHALQQDNPSRWRVLRLLGRLAAAPDGDARLHVANNLGGAVQDLLIEHMHGECWEDARDMYRDRE